MNEWKRNTICQLFSWNTIGQFWLIKKTYKFTFQVRMNNNYNLKKARSDSAQVCLYCVEFLWPISWFWIFFYKKIIHANMKCSIARYFSFCLFLLVKKRFFHLSWLTQVLCLSLYDCPSIGLISTMCVFQLFILVMGPRPGLARARPGACPFFRAWAQNFEKGPDSTQVQLDFLRRA